MDRMLRILVCTGMLMSGLILLAQEPATIDNEPAVRFEQGGGYYNYAAFCRTPTDFSTQMPKTGLAIDKIEFAIGWYVRGSVTRGGAASPEVDGRIVVSQHHIRFMPANPQNADQYFDIPHGEAELAHSSGEAGGVLQGKDVSLRFELRRICPTCAAGAAIPPGGNAERLDQEFALLNDTVTHFVAGWRTTYKMSKGEPAGNGGTSTATASAPSASPAVSFAPSRPAANSTEPAERAPAVVRTSAPMPAMGLAIGRPVKIGSGAADGLLVKKIPPSYPLEAKLVRLEGTVVLHAVIDRTGEVSQVNALSGPPLLESAAVDAVRQWQYRPYAVNGQAVDVETTIQVVFALDGNRPTTHAQNARARQ